MSTLLTVVGNLAGDPELRYSPAGLPYVSFSLAHGERKRSPEGEWIDDGTSWYRVTAFRELAEHVAASLTKGARVHVTGTLRLRGFERADGSKGLAAEISAAEISPSLRFATAVVTRTGGSVGAEPPAVRAVS